MINLVSWQVIEAPDIQMATFSQFMDWQRDQIRFMVDTETTTDHWWSEKKLRLIQFGNEKDEWLLHWASLTNPEKEEVGRILFDHRIKVLHNAYFDCVILRFAGIVMRNVYCTMVAEMELNCGKLNREDDEEDLEGAEFGFYSLAGVLDRRLNLRISKDEQMGFDIDILTESKVRYAAIDVRHLFKILQMQKLDLHIWRLEMTAALDMASLPGLAEMTFHGMPIDDEKWRANIDAAVPIVQQARIDLEAEILTDPRLLDYCLEKGFYSNEDRVMLNRNSPKQMQWALSLLFPDLQGTSKAVVRKYMRDNDVADPVHRHIIQMYEAGETGPLEEYLCTRHRDEMINRELLIPAHTFTINWNSTVQVLGLFQQLDKKLQSLNKQHIAKFPFSIGLRLQEFKDATKLTTTYGEDFLAKHMERDGRVRTTFNPIVSTGRLSSRNPNMQNIPAKKKIGNRYRNCFIAEPHYKYVDSDYASQELVVIAFMSKDPVWTKALQEGKDLHSICADLLFKKAWRDNAEPGCAYMAHQQKCKCKGHEKQREAVKTINFGLAYGMSKYKLAATMKISVDAAQSLIDEFFKEFPTIGETLRYLGTFGVTLGYIQTMAPFFRKRWFPYWRLAKDNIDSHLKGVLYDQTLGSIERASKNMPIQGSSADMTKVGIWMMFEDIHLNNLPVKLVMQVHDQLTTRAENVFAEEWKLRMHNHMLAAGKLIVTNGLLGAETNITDVWTK